MSYYLRSLITEIVTIVLITLVVTAFASLIVAYPVKWCWNYAVVPSCGAGTLSWGQAWCLSFMTGLLVSSSASRVKVKS